MLGVGTGAAEQTVVELATAPTAETAPPRGAPAPGPSARRPVGWSGFRRWLQVGSWIFVGGLCVLTLSLRVEIPGVARVAPLFQGLVPFVYLPAWIIGLVALLTRRWVLASACAILALVHVLLVAPVLGSDPLPRWAATAPKVRVLAANLWNQNESPEAAARRVVHSDADVLALVEVSSRMHGILERAGLRRRFPYQMHAEPSPDGDTDGIYSRIPFTSTHVYPVLENRLPSVTVGAGGRRLRIVAVHIDGALHGAGQWRGELDGLAPIARHARGPLVMAGDFNATRWHPPFRRLLGHGLSDAHESRGRGLSRSWPVRGTMLSTFGPLMRLDHALVNRSAAVTELRDVAIPGSDHVAFEAAVALK